MAPKRNPARLVERWTVAGVLSCGVLAGVAPGASAQSVAPPPAATATPAGAARPEPFFPLTVPVFYDGEPITTIEANVATSGAFEAGRDDVIEVLRIVLSDDALATVEADLARVETVTAAEAERAGFAIVFDPQAVALRLTTERGARRTTDILLNEPVDDSAMFDRSPRPARVSAFVNLTGGIEFDTGGGDDGGGLGALIGADGAIRAANTVLRSSAFYETESGEFQTGSIQLVRDFIDLDVRAIAGDVDVIGSTLIAGPDLVGLSLSHREGRFGRQRTIEPVTAQVFDLDRSSIVEIYIDDTLQRRLRLTPGQYNIADFSLRSGASDLRIVTTDDSGNRDEIILSNFGGVNLLRPGALEWEAAIGLETEDDLVDFDTDADADDVVATARFEYGLSPALSVGAATIARVEGQAVSLSADAALPFGSGRVDVGASVADGDAGGAISASFSPVLPAALARPGRSVGFSAFYASELFSNAALPDADNAQLRLNMRFTEPFSIGAKAARASLFGSYQSFLDEEKDQFQLGANVSFDVFRDIGLTIGSAYERDIDGEEEFVATLSLVKAFGDNIATSASYSTDNNTYVAAASYRNQFSGVGTYDASIAAQSSDLSDTSISAVGGYVGNRYTLAGSFAQDVVDQDDTGDLTSRAAATLSTAIVFAGGRVGIARPITDSFAIFTRHPSIRDATATLNPGRLGNGPEMVSDGLGPLVGGAIGSYAASTQQIQVDGLPVGYDLGTGVYEIAGPLNAGYVLEIGSDRAASALGSAVDRRGDALAFASGTVTSPDDGGFEEQRIFTNGAGRFLVQSLVPGRRYDIRFQGADGVVSFDTEPDSFELNRIGTITVDMQRGTGR